MELAVLSFLVFVTSIALAISVFVGVSRLGDIRDELKMLNAQTARVNRDTFCGKCGAVVNERSRFCGICGGVLDGHAPIATPVASPKATGAILGV